MKIKYSQSFRQQSYYMTIQKNFNKLFTSKTISQSLNEDRKFFYLVRQIILRDGQL